MGGGNTAPRLAVAPGDASVHGVAVAPGTGPPAPSHRPPFRVRRGRRCGCARQARTVRGGARASRTATAARAGGGARSRTPRRSKGCSLDPLRPCISCGGAFLERAFTPRDRAVCPAAEKIADPGYGGPIHGVRQARDRKRALDGRENRPMIVPRSPGSGSRATTSGSGFKKNATRVRDRACSSGPCSTTWRVCRTPPCPVPRGCRATRGRERRARSRPPCSCARLR